VSARTIRRRIADGKLPARRVGPRLLQVNLADLDELIRPALY
jgi:excisionase family DNA binding protein